MDTSSQIHDSPCKLRRHSFSAPAKLCLDRLDTATRILGSRVSSLSSLVSRSRESPEVSLIPLLILSSPNSTSTMGRTCHGCHAPLDSDHQSFPSGWQKCPLEHWDGCQGGIVEGKGTNGKEWRGCPPDYVGGAAGGEDSFEVENIGSDHGLKSSEITLDDINDDTGDNMLRDLYEKTLETQEKNPKIIEVEEVDKVATIPDDSEIDVLEQLEAANLLLKKQVADRAKLEKAERDRKIAMLKAENLQLTDSMKGDNGGAKSKIHQKVPNPKNQVKSSTSSLQHHLTKNQLRTSEYRPETSSNYSGLNIKGIRKIPGIQSQVEDLINDVQHRAPSLDRRPSFVQVKNPPQPQHSISQHRTGRADSAVQEGDPETSSDEELDDEPQHGHVFRWRRDQNGEKYYVEEKQVTRQEADQVMEYRYVKDEVSGRSYKRLVLKKDPSKELVPQWVIDPGTGRQVQMLVPSQTSSKTGFSSSVTDNRSFHGNYDDFNTPLPPFRTPRRASLASSQTPLHLQEDKQGKMPSLVQFARNCPVNWTSKVTSDKLNMGLWSWSYVAELLATRTGQAPPLESGELEARMQHFLNVLEVALQPGNSPDFDNQAWKVARLYAEKVQQKVDRGDTWLGFARRYGTDSHPHELMAAEKELAPKNTKKKEDEGFKKKDEKKDEKRRTCTTWNTSRVEGKCEYEVQYDGRSCSRRHECSWCKEKGKSSLRHQRTFCRPRLAAGDQ